MSNTLVSQQLTLPMIPENQPTQVNSGVSKADKSMLNHVEGSIESLSNNPTTDTTSLRVEDHSSDCNSAFGVAVEQDMSTSYNLDRQTEAMPNDVKSQQSAMPGKETEQPQVMQRNLAQMNLSTPNKRKATAELLPDNWGPQKLSASNKRVTQVGLSTKASSPNSVSTSNSLRSGASNKRVVQAEPVKNISQSTGSKKNVQSQMSSKPFTESYESVRAKLRESLAAALTLVPHQQEISDLNTQVRNDVAGINQKGVEVTSLVPAASNETDHLKSEKSEEACTSSFPCPTDACNDLKNVSGGSHSKEIEEATQTWNYMDSDFQSNTVLSGEDVSFSNNFFFKDDLLQGNGLSWAADFNPHIPDVKQVKHTEKPELLQEEVVSHENEQIMQSPESVAFQIESELYKLFGGVNKKYKEKGRSLLFNLKDRNNPELRERVMSGEILPGRLCSMTAEELASKELSQWRIAKAEELAQMKVLPDSEANMRRLVKKTHKGEYQVDLDPDVGASEEIPVGNVPLRNLSKTNNTKTGALPKSDKAKEGQSNKCEITFPNDETDMQGLIMVDDVRDFSSTLSFDEFMESLDKEPPFEDIPGRTRHESNDEKLELGPESVYPEQYPVDAKSEKTESMLPAKPSKHSVEIASKRNKSMSPVHTSNHSGELTLERTDGASVECVDPASGVRLTDTQKRLNTSAIHLQKGERVWEGLLQLTISSMAGFIALYKSGEKPSTREWPGFLEIKGRVKLDAFDNFVQALPMSRSRSIMVTHFVLKEGSSDSDHASLQEVIDSYNMDQRLGIAAPAPGVELYLCPPRSKSVDVIFGHLNRSFTDKLKDIDYGLIGLLVWRKLQITPSSVSLNPSSHQNKDVARKIEGQNVENDTRRDTSFGSRNASPSPIPSYSQPTNQENDDDDDAPPPGFGPPVHRREDDDLPEFNFSGSLNQPISHIPSHHHHNSHLGAPSHKVEKMRELIQKYGQNGNKPSGGILIQPWNDDDDEDDMPEWQPQPPLPPQPIAAHNSVLAPPMVNQPQLQRPLQHSAWSPVGQQLQPLQRPMGAHQQGAWWPYGHNNIGNQPMVGRGWRPNASNNRGH